MESPDIRGSQNVFDNPKISTQAENQNRNENVQHLIETVQHSQTNKSRQYSEIVQNSQSNEIRHQPTETVQPKRTMTYPKKEQAIVLGVVDDLKLMDYVIAVGNIVGPRNITFASRISNNRICIYLANTQLVDAIVTEHSIITIQDREVSVRKFITPARRIIISNVCPTIPHNLVESVLRGIGLQLASSVSFMRAGIPGDEYSHILSFRRQVYVNPNSNMELPSSVVIKHDETNYRLYLSFDDISCFICKQANHIAKNCPQLISFPTVNHSAVSPPQNGVENPTASIAPNNQQDMSDSSTDKDPSTNLSAQQTPSATPLPKKRQASSIASTVASSPVEESTDLMLFPHTSPTLTTPNANASNKSKKMRKSSSTESLSDIEVSLEPIKVLIDENPSKFVLNFHQIVQFFESVHGSPDALSVAKQYTTDITGLIENLSELHSRLSQRNIKTKCTRIRKKLQLQLDNELDISDEDFEKSQLATN